MKVSEVVKLFSLSPVCEKQLRVIAKDSPEQALRIESLREVASKVPGMLATAKAQLLAELSATSAIAPSAPTAPSAPSAPPARVIAYTCAPGSQVIAWAGSVPAGHNLAWYEGGSEWETIGTASTASATTTATWVDVDPKSIPLASSGKGKLPWVLSVNRAKKDGRLFASFGIMSGGRYASLQKCSVPLDELLESLSDANVSAMRRELLSLQSQLS